MVAVVPINEVVAVASVKKVAQAEHTPIEPALKAVVEATDATGVRQFDGKHELAPPAVVPVHPVVAGAAAVASRVYPLAQVAHPFPVVATCAEQYVA